MGALAFVAGLRLDGAVMHGNMFWLDAILVAAGVLPVLALAGAGAVAVWLVARWVRRR